MVLFVAQLEGGSAVKIVRRHRTFRTLIAALALLCLVPTSLAEQVTPSGRVVTRLRARDQPNSKGEVIGYLKPGENAELVKTTGAWREVKAGTWSGFMPSGYTVVLPDEPAPAPTTAAVQPEPATQATKPKAQAGKAVTCGDGQVLTCPSWRC